MYIEVVHWLGAARTHAVNQRFPARALCGVWICSTGPPHSKDRARLAALGSVASVIDTMGDDVPALLVDAHRFLATGLTDEDREALARAVAPNDKAGT